MTETVTIKLHSETYHKIDCDQGIAQELTDYFSFYAPGYQYMPAFKQKYWDGKIRLFSGINGLLYAGLDDYVKKFCEEREYQCVAEIADAPMPAWSDADVATFIQSIGLPQDKPPRDYQLECFKHSVNKGRSLNLLPTASGKSLCIYMLARCYQAPKQKVLIIVPTIGLVRQLAGDFESYGARATDVHSIMGGESKDTNRPFVISTWQSIYKMPKAWFKQFNCVIGDEAHGFQAKSLTTIMEKCDHIPHRFGFTGTLDGTECHKLILEGLFGIVRRFATTKELMDRGFLSPLQIEGIVLEHPDDTKKLLSKQDYHKQREFVALCKARNEFIVNLAMSLKGNTLILFELVGKSGKIIQQMLEADGRKPVFFVAGEVEGEVREQIRKIVEKHENAIINASMGTFSTGIDIPTIQNIIGVGFTKAPIRLLQAIGRGLRKAVGKMKCTLYDLADDMQWKTKRNHSLRHFVERAKIYATEDFVFRPHKVQLKY